MTISCGKVELIIIGAGGFGLEVFWLAERLGYEVIGFLDDIQDQDKEVISGKKILGKVSDWQTFKESQFTLAVGAPVGRKKIYNKMTEASAKPLFATLIDPFARVGINVNIGEGSIICAGVVLTAQINVGIQTIINLNCTIGHETKIGDFVTIAPLTAISGRVIIGENVELGTSSAVRPGLEIGSNSLLGMGGILTKNMPENTVFYGNPAKFIKSI